MSGTILPNNPPPENLQSLIRGFPSIPIYRVHLERSCEIYWTQLTTRSPQHRVVCKAVASAARFSLEVGWP
jgi:hypothetical protein